MSQQREAEEATKLSKAADVEAREQSQGAEREDQGREQRGQQLQKRLSLQILGTRT